MRTYVAWLHLRQRQASFKSPGNLYRCMRLCGWMLRSTCFGGSSAFLTRFIFCQTNVHDQSCASRKSLAVILARCWMICRCPKLVRKWALGQLVWEVYGVQGVKRYAFRNALQEYDCQQINGMLRSSMPEGPTYSIIKFNQNLFREVFRTRGHEAKTRTTQSTRAKQPQASKNFRDRTHDQTKITTKIAKLFSCFNTPVFCSKN